MRAVLKVFSFILPKREKVKGLKPSQTRTLTDAWDGIARLISQVRIALRQETCLSISGWLASELWEYRCVPP